MVRRVQLIERPSRRGHGGRLGRHVEHDERSRAFASTAPVEGPLLPTLHRRHVPIFDQGRYLDRRTGEYVSLGSCTGNALAGALSTSPFLHRFGESTAVRLYSRATELDEFDGVYPPDDTGSSGLAVCKAALEHRWISEYRHAFSLGEALYALMRGPVIFGTSWLEAFDRPDSRGRISIGGSSRGGHEWVARGVDPDERLVYADNSWGPGWGLHGSFFVPFDVLEVLLDDDGDATIPVP